MAQSGNHSAQPPLEVMLLQSAGDIIGLDGRHEHDPESTIQALGQINIFAAEQAEQTRGRERFTAQLYARTVSLIALGRSPRRSLKREYGLPAECTDAVLAADAISWLRRAYEATLPQADANAPSSDVTPQRTGNDPGTVASTHRPAKTVSAKLEYEPNADRFLAGRRDQDLLEKLLAGDSSAYGELYVLHYDVLRGYAARKLPDGWEDVVQETFLRGLRAIQGSSQPDFSRQGGAAPWFVTIAKNIILDIYKSARYKLEKSYDDLEYNGVTASDNVERLVEQRVTAETLKEGVDRLKEMQREVVALRFYEDISVEETAQRLGVNAGAVKARQHRAIQGLRADIGGLVAPTEQPDDTIALVNDDTAETAIAFDDHAAAIEPFMDVLEALVPTESSRRARVIAAYIADIITLKEGAEQLDLSPQLFKKYYVPLRDEVLSSLSVEVSEPLSA